MRRARFAKRLPVFALASVLALVAITTSPMGATAAPGDIGYEGPSFAGLSGAATGEKPESKLWWNDGHWWASMWDAAAGGHWIHRLDLATQTWVNTGTALDPRASRADTLWEAASGKLYVASHDFTTSGGTFSPGARMYRFSYNPSTDTYALDAGFPVTINAARSESLVIDRDSSGQLWATWVQLSPVSGQGRRVFVSHSLCNPVCNDAAWGTPFSPSVNGTSVSSDDISSIIAFGNNRIGLIWSNQSQDAAYFSTHDDSAADTTWQASEQIFQGSDQADDHINLATLLTDDGGRIFVVTKTSLNASNAPLLNLLERNPSTGAWTSHVYSTGQYDQTRPIVLVDESAGRLHVFSSDEGGGGIYHKSTPLSNISFADGKGTLVMWDDDSHEINDATSTKQNLSNTTGMVILASNDQTDRYWHYFDPLGGTPPPPAAPVANFSATPTSGVAPLTVTFTDASTNSPTSWAWDFDNNGTIDSTVQHPQHAYTAAGAYSVTLTATNAGGGGTLTKTGYISVGPGGGGGGTQTFAPVADARTSSNSPNNNTGTDVTLRVRTASTNSFNSYLKFNLSGLGSQITSAVVRLYVTSGTNSGGSMYVVDPGWSEGGITWNNAPPISGTPLDSNGAVTTGTWVEWDVTNAVSGNGTLSLGLKNAGGSGTYSSREATNKPQLVVVSGGTPPPPAAPVANFSATPTSGVAPLTVTFTDASTNSPTSWAWDFDNNGTIDSTVQHPQHAYTAAGAYSVTLTATNAGGGGTLTKTGYISVGPGGGGGGTQTFAPVADARTSSNSPNNNTGTDVTLRVRTASTNSFNSYLKFNLSGLGSQITSAVVRLYVTSGTNSGGSMYVVDPGWSEGGITWNNAPPISGTPLDSNGAVTTGTWVEWDVTNAVSGNGTLSLGLKNAGGSGTYSSREATNKPQLVVVSGP